MPLQTQFCGDNYFTEKIYFVYITKRVDVYEILRYNGGMKYYVVADPHGYYTYLEQTLRVKGFFEDKEPHKLIICGDLFDRGGEAKKMQEFVLDLLRKDQIILIRGNHEDLAIEFVKNAWRYIQWGLKSSHHYSNGTVDTFCQLIDMNLYDMAIFPSKAVDLMENTPYIKNIIPSMVDYYETPNYIFVHGWIPCKASGFGGQVSNFEYDKKWRKASPKEFELARWYNGMLAVSQGVIEPNKTIVCGHWHCSYGHSKLEHKGCEFGENADFSPYIGKGIIALDACTIESRKINCIIIND